MTRARDTSRVQIGINTAVSGADEFTYDALNIFNFTSSSASSHRFSGAYAEVAYFKDIRITDAVRDAWKSYLVDKFAFQ